ncbi:hypothetical protein PCIT_b0296 [Pseudoalteromonas citrea]|uniref:Uncharacterized protein n=1 Tax=Pseudoalteromonas citrea TaxID=43655 RepID=A0AAD4FPP6_9GAMM|nr:hypothetical protein PCIT_b0296 [Pseudoalteromonas citrea]
MGRFAVYKITIIITLCDFRFKVFCWVVTMQNAANKADNSRTKVAITNKNWDGF